MAIPHSESGEIIDIRPLQSRLKDCVTSTLIKTDDLEVLRLVVLAGLSIDRHQVPGEVTVQCLEGRVIFDAGGRDRELVPGTMLYLQGETPHALRSRGQLAPCDHSVTTQGGSHRRITRALRDLTSVLAIEIVAGIEMRSNFAASAV